MLERERELADRVRKLNAFLIGGGCEKTWETRRERGSKDKRQGTSRRGAISEGTRGKEKAREKVTVQPAHSQVRREQQCVMGNEGVCVSVCV